MVVGFHVGAGTEQPALLTVEPSLLPPILLSEQVCANKYFQLPKQMKLLKASRKTLIKQYGN